MRRLSGGRELTYNSKDQLIRVAYERDGQSVETNHVYGCDGQRVVTESPAGVSIWFGPDLVEHNEVVDHYVKVGDRLVARVRSSATNNETSSLDSPVQTEITYLHRSMGAGPVGISNASGLLTHERRYEPFGHGIDASISVEGHSSPPPSEVDFLQEPFNVLNKPTDSSTGLSYHGARWYMSSQARWLTPDALVQIPNLRFASSPWELHPYQYVGHRPLELWDPDGNDGISWKDSVWVTFQNAVDFTGSLIKATVIQGPCPCGIKPGARREMNDFRSRRADRLRRLESRSLSKSSKSVRGGTSTATRGGAKTVLGKFPDYVNLADDLAAKRFSIPTKIWNKMSPAEQWAANRKFLDRMIARGDEIILSNPVKKVSEATGWFGKELNYLLEQGFRLSADGTRMIR